MIRHGHHVPSQCPKQKHFPPVLVAILYISGGGDEHAIFVMGVMLLASALNRGSHRLKIFKMAINTGGNASI